MKGIIFDFNGTMFQDSHFHEEAWFQFIHEHAREFPDKETILTNLHGRTNQEIIEQFISINLSLDEMNHLSKEKEKQYRKLCASHPKELKLTTGLADVLNQLNKMNIPKTIATATTKENVEFYFKTFNLDRWFDFDKVVYDNGTFPGKPQPDIFVIAAKKINQNVENCVVIEDAYSGLIAANRAGIGTIIAIDPFNKNKELFMNENLANGGIINDFNSFLSLINL